MCWLLVAPLNVVEAQRESGRDVEADAIRPRPGFAGAGDLGIDQTRAPSQKRAVIFSSLQRSRTIDLAGVAVQVDLVGECELGDPMGIVEGVAGVFGEPS
jgi:hypothetical protein